MTWNDIPDKALKETPLIAADFITVLETAKASVGSEHIGSSYAWSELSDSESA
jgi:hypothetical protein